MIIIGHSFGGYIACKYALRHPEKVQKLILLSPAGITKAAPGSEEISEAFIRE